jgi:hypothetical protein
MAAVAGLVAFLAVTDFAVLVVALAIEASVFCESSLARIQTVR